MRYALVLTILSLLPLGASAVTIDVTLSATTVNSLGPVTFLVGVQDENGNPVDVNGYTLDYTFDAAELSFVEAAQLANFGGGAVEGFLAFGDCTSGRCAAGNTPTEDALGVGALFSLSFTVIDRFDDGLADLEVGILDPGFDDVTQGTGQPPFDEGDVVAQGFVVPEPASVALLALALGGLAAIRRHRT